MNIYKYDLKTLARYTIKIVFILLVMLSLTKCNCDFFGAHDLGNKLILLEGDKLEDRAIVYCTGYSDGCCMAGMYVIPSIGNQYQLYVETAKSDSNWVVAKTIQVMDKQENYWIIRKDFDIKNLDCDEVNCDSIIQSHVNGPFAYQAFNYKLQEWNIDIEFE